MDQLPVPKRIKDYLKTPNYYSENITEEDDENELAEPDFTAKPSEAEQVLETPQDFAAAMWSFFIYIKSLNTLEKLPFYTSGRKVLYPYETIFLVNKRFRAFEKLQNSSRKKNPPKMDQQLTKSTADP